MSGVYPSTFFGLFPAFPKDEHGFVAMSFHPRFDARWEDVIAPAIRSVRVNDVPLEPHRVDLRSASDSILTEILDGIAGCRIFVADITAIGEVDGKGVRNSNVMYEVGLAHAVRQPEEVVLFRSDDLELGFDIANVRVHHYDPDGSPLSARKFVTEIIVQSLKEVDLKKNLAVKKAAQSLDFRSWIMLAHSFVNRPFFHPSTQTMGQALGAVADANAIDKLLEIGALQAEFIKPEAVPLAEPAMDNLRQAVKYHITSFGLAIYHHVQDMMGVNSP